MAEKKPGVFRRIIIWFKDTGEWVQENLGDDAITAEMREDLGLNPNSVLPKSELAKLPEFAKNLDPEKESFAETVSEIQQAADVLLALASAAKHDQVSAYDTLLLLSSVTANESIRLQSPFLFAVGQLAFILRDDAEALGRLDPGQLTGLLRGDAPPPGGAERFHQRLFATLPLLMEILPRLLGRIGIHVDRSGIDLESYYGWDPAPGSPTPEADLISMRALTLLLSLASAPFARLALTIVSVPRTHGGPGMLLSVGGSLSADAVVDGTRYRITTGGSGAFDLFIPLGSPAMALEANGDPQAFVKIEAMRSEPGVPAFRLGDANGTRLDIGSIRIGVELNAKSGGLGFSFDDAAIIIKLSEGDGFLKNLSQKEVAVRFTFGIVLDTEGGLRLSGGTRAAVTLPVATTILDAFTVHHADIRLGAGKQPDSFAIEVSAALSLALGPFRASIDRIGFEVEGAFRDGNLGFLDLDPGFRSPNGIGLVLDTKHIKGGGYLFIDRARGEYAGILEVKVGPVNIKAIGLLQTRSEGRDDWSLVVFLFGQFPPVPLLIPGLNWSGIGGMVGVRRGVEVNQLQAGIRIGALDDILFPKDPVADAPRLINQFRAFFPHNSAAFTIGAFLELGFLKPQVVKLRVGVIVQADRVEAGNGDRDVARVIVLGQVLVQVPPNIDKPVVKLICDIFGVIDLEAKLVTFTARLRDSKVATFTLTGMMYLRKEYGEKPVFILSVGGFHPDFKELPPGLPAPIDRLGIQPIKIAGLKLEVTGYFAITPNTKQFGIAGKLKGKVSSLTLEAALSIDALVLDEPYPHFVVTVKFLLQLKYKSHTLAGIRANLRVEGPSYWRINGPITFEILWWDIEIPIDEECGAKPLILPSDVNLGEVVQAALAAESAWEAKLPPGSEGMVTIATGTGAVGTFAHPLADLTIIQNAAPLGVRLERFGGARITGANHFEVVEVRIGASVIDKPEPLTRPFGRSQFFDMTEEQRLTSPSFEPFAAGVSVTGADYAFGAAVSADLDFETAYLDMEAQTPVTRSVRTVLTATSLPTAALAWQSRNGSAARSALRERVRASRPMPVRVTPVDLVVVNENTLAPSGVVALDDTAAHSPTMAQQRVRASGAPVTVLEAFETELS